MTIGEKLKRMFGWGGRPSAAELQKQAASLDIDARMRETDADFRRRKMRDCVEAAVAAGDRLAKERHLQEASNHKRRAERAESEAKTFRKTQWAIESITGIAEVSQRLENAMAGVSRLGMAELQQMAQLAREQITRATVVAERLETEAATLAAITATSPDKEVSDMARIVEGIETQMVGVQDATDREKVISGIIDRL